MTDSEYGELVDLLHYGHELEFKYGRRVNSILWENNIAS